MPGFLSLGGGSGGGGGGELVAGSVVTSETRMGDRGGSIAVPGTTASMAGISDGTGAIEVDIAAAVGDKLLISFTCDHYTGGASAILMGTFEIGGTIVSSASTGLVTNGADGNQTTFHMQYEHEVEVGDIDAGLVNVKPLLGDAVQNVSIANESWGVPVLTVVCVAPPVTQEPAEATPQNPLATSDDSINNPTNQPEDYEFGESTSDLPSGWTWYNQGGATYSEGAGAGVIIVPTGTMQVRGIVRDIPVGDGWTAYAKMTPALLSSVAADLISFGFCLRDSATGEQIVVRHGSQTGCVVTTFNNDAFAGAANVAGSGYAATSGTYVFQIRRNDANSYHFFVSHTGHAYHTLIESVDVGALFTPDQMGFFFYNDSGKQTGFHVDYFRMVVDE
jgi:hypothetical protein